MKRSEVIRVISQYTLTDRINPPLDSYDFKRAELDAEELLTLLENMGMQPPTITVMKNTYNRADGTYGFDANEWEPEDDTN